MAKASTVMTKHLSLISELQKAGRPDTVKEPLVTTRAAAAAQKSRVENRIAELEKQRLAYNKKMDAAIEAAQREVKEIERFEEMVKERDEIKTDDTPTKPTPKKPNVKVDTVLKANVRKTATTTKTTTPKRRTPKK